MGISEMVIVYKKNGAKNNKDDLRGNHCIPLQLTIFPSTRCYHPDFHFYLPCQKMQGKSRRKQHEIRNVAYL
jgi:hypothetical protein